ncbi:hypothetical protein B7463_g3899, partial [Scytalidium lignicola]
MKVLIPALTWLCTLSLTSATFLPKTVIIPSAPANGTSIANYISTANGLDGPQLSSVNSSVYDWWYFDAVSPDLKTSITIVFYTALASGFPSLPDLPETTVVQISSSLPNGSTTSDFLPASEAIVSTTGSSGSYRGAGASWIAPAGYSEAPAHYSCGPNEPGQDMHVGPNVGWANAVPDAVGDVNFVIHGTRLAFTGVAYHDKNWGDVPFTEAVGSWYWGHGRLGEYSIVWFSFLTPTGENHVSAYVSKNNKILTASCKLGSITVRPTGPNDVYPPKIGNPPPGGFLIEVEIDEEGEKKLKVNVTQSAVAIDSAGVYYRMLGSMKGGVEHGPELTGVALYEQFTLV